MKEIMKQTDEQTRAIERVRNEFENTIHKYERRAEGYAKKMNDDFEYFFRMYGDKMYTTEYNIKQLREFRPAIYLDTAEKIESAIRSSIEDIEIELVEGDLDGRSPSLIQNTAYVFARAAKQELRADLQRMLWVME